MKEENENSISSILKQKKTKKIFQGVWKKKSPKIFLSIKSGLKAKNEQNFKNFEEKNRKNISGHKIWIESKKWKNISAILKKNKRKNISKNKNPDWKQKNAKIISKI